MSSTKRNELGWRGQREALRDLHAWGVHAVPLGEQGRNDQGDLEIEDRDTCAWIVEVKRAQQVSVRRVLAHADGKRPDPPIVWWQPITAPSGKSGRQYADGRPVAALWAHDLAALLSGRSAPVDGGAA